MGHSTSEAAELVLLMREIYAVSRCDGLRPNDIHTSLLYLMSHRLIMQQLFITFCSSVYSPLHVSASL
jgi:hypothetical protein